VFALRYIRANDYFGRGSVLTAGIFRLLMPRSRFERCVFFKASGFAGGIWPALSVTGSGFIEGKIIDEMLEHGQLLYRQVLELHSASPRGGLFPGEFRNFLIVYYPALDPVYVDKMAVAAKYCYSGALFFITVCRQILDAQPVHADILD